VKPRRLKEITSHYAGLKIALVGDICLDRYFEIDPNLRETSIETQLPVHNVINIRCQPGGAGTILNNLVALGVGSILPVAIIGKDGEGYELRRALDSLDGVDTSGLIESPQRRTFTYSKPLLMQKSGAPVELNRLDTKNWTPTPELLQGKVVERIRDLAARVDVLVLLDQVDLPETGVITQKVLDTIREIVAEHPDLLILADSRRSLRGYPRVSLKMNAAELAALAGSDQPFSPDEVAAKALSLSEEYGRPVFVTLAGQGMVAARQGNLERVPSLPVRGEIDIVGAGDAVTANIATALAAGATLRETLELAQLAASIVIHQLGTTGAASVKALAECLLNSPFLEE
jgi:rfaE bifunctional protein kinase chain/domain